MVILGTLEVPGKWAKGVIKPTNWELQDSSMVVIPFAWLENTSKPLALEHGLSFTGQPRPGLPILKFAKKKTVANGWQLPSDDQGWKTIEWALPALIALYHF